MLFLWKPLKVRFLHFIMFSCLLLMIQGCYTLKLAYHQIRIFNTREKVSELRSNPTISSSIRLKFSLINDILSQARKEGLRVGAAYQHFIKYDPKATIYVLQVAHQLRLKWVTWWFPIVGDVSYLGFFHKAERDKESLFWQEKSYDVLKLKSQAFSSLGWFNDPLYESMLKRDDEDLIELIYHELIHRTIWIKGEVDFNEQLATYFSRVLTRSQLELKNKIKSTVIYEKKIRDQKKFALWLTSFKDSLEKYYERADLFSKEQLLQGKKNLFLFYLKEKRPDFEVLDPIGKSSRWNNARILSENMYNPKTPSFDRGFSCLGHLNVGKKLKYFKDYVYLFKNPYDALEHMCKASSKQGEIL